MLTAKVIRIFRSKVNIEKHSAIYLDMMAVNAQYYSVKSLLSVFCAYQCLVRRSAFHSIFTFPRGPKHEGKECRHYQQKEEQWQPHGQGYPPPRTRQYTREFECEQDVERNASNEVELDGAYRL